MCEAAPRAAAACAAEAAAHAAGACAGAPRGGCEEAQPLCADAREDGPEAAPAPTAAPQPAAPPLAPTRLAEAWAQARLAAPLCVFNFLQFSVSAVSVATVGASLSQGSPPRAWRALAYLRVPHAARRCTLRRRPTVCLASPVVQHARAARRACAAHAGRGAACRLAGVAVDGQRACAEARPAARAGAASAPCLGAPARPWRALRWLAGAFVQRLASRRRWLCACLCRARA
jgi:hypothetical protein